MPPSFSERPLLLRKLDLQRYIRTIVRTSKKYWFPFAKAFSDSIVYEIGLFFFVEMPTTFPRPVFGRILTLFHEAGLESVPTNLLPSKDGRQPSLAISPFSSNIYSRLSPSCAALYFFLPPIPSGGSDSVQKNRHVSAPS